MPSSRDLSPVGKHRRPRREDIHSPLLGGVTTHRPPRCPCQHPHPFLAPPSLMAPSAGGLQAPSGAVLRGPSVSAGVTALPAGGSSQTVPSLSLPVLTLSYPARLTVRAADAGALPGAPRQPPAGPQTLPLAPLSAHARTAKCPLRATASVHAKLALTLSATSEPRVRQARLEAPMRLLAALGTHIPLPRTPELPWPRVHPPAGRSAAPWAEPGLPGRVPRGLRPCPRAPQRLTAPAGREQSRLVQAHPHPPTLALVLTLKRHPDACIPPQ
ncbi:unnamed protein product [Rangifer tarandus platyrhynchus]|uniref:Uncharacterized protein n=2 Tax=Rangifer tarandus platyrhynchus TaxID=3082113 RepID=A0ACB0EWB2_RANTA|nr:unnamed protein product [Rangifer tarandus platyrhynchus]CAI9704893.1 unnamed protein product [Rangifer tarandus platyrhynchus]